MFYTTQQHRDQNLQHSAPKLAIDCIGFLQQSKRSKEICIYIYICIWNTADLYYSNRASYQTFCEYEAKKHYSIELRNFICVQLRSRHWQKKNALHPHTKSLISCVEGTDFYRSTLFLLSKSILCKTCSMLRLDLRSKLPQSHAATASAALTTLGHQVKIELCRRLFRTTAQRRTTGARVNCFCIRYCRSPVEHCNNYLRKAPG